MYRFLLIVAIALAFVSQFYVVALLLFVVSLVKYTGFELVVLAFIIDGYYGAFDSVPLASIIVFLVWSAGVLLRERLMLYTRDYETLS